MNRVSDDLYPITWIIFGDETVNWHVHTYLTYAVSDSVRDLRTNILFDLSDIFPVES